MPELPDLTLFARNLKKQVLGKPIASATIHNRRPTDVPAETFAAAVAGAEIVDIVREGKELHFLLSNQNRFGVHLMLHGEFGLTTADKLDAVRSKIVSLTFRDGSALAVSDFDSLCKVALNPPPSKVPDALSPAFDRAYLAGIARRKTTTLKGFLVDQKIVRGIGNAYADEILWKANLSPECTVGKLPEEALADLHAAIGSVLTEAIETLERLTPDAIRGEERSFLRVHNPRRRTTEDGEPIVVKQIANKQTYYTKKQRLYL